MSKIAIVGGGPAGMMAACVLADAGLRPVLFDEADHVGGQGWRWPGANQATDIRRLLGKDAATWNLAHTQFEAALPGIDYRRRHAVWGMDGKTVQFTTDTGKLGAFEADRLILATGATDRIMPITGWTRPGVFTLGGVQTLLKGHGCAIGEAVVFCGSSPLLYLAALQYKLAGAHVVAILDTTSFARKMAAVPHMTGNLPMLMRGLDYIRELRRLGVPIHYGVGAMEVLGEDEVEAIRYSDGRGRQHILSCDGVAFGFGLRPETQLAEIAGCEMHYVEALANWFPKVDADGRARADLYLAGDGCLTGGADAAAASGRLAAYALLRDMGRAVPEAEVAELRRRVARLRGFQKGLARAFRWPQNWAAAVQDDTVLCRCENVTAGQVRAAAMANIGPVEINRAKAVTRNGMGRCQGRMCGLASAEILSQCLSIPVCDTGWGRAQAPIKPLHLGQGD